ncbi:MAG: DNA gyrase subunit A [Bdellovibrionales bacterium RBG_16_40_8]|nr:MAG: DNA gyrase subunit A [Bdellovibrionales bacterium RBG_16_40_8]
MFEPREHITDVDISKEMSEAYLQYSMSVIVGRALPDVRDGLKPVHRRVLFAMHELGNNHDKPYKKSARVVGDVIGKYHPHGDTAVYDTIVRMAQDFSLRFPLVDGQGNFGSIDGDSPAAQRYTEVRMTRLAEELLEDIDKETVAWGSNYDDSLQIPLVLPAKFPNLLVNGSAGIAVGMATNIPPHNLGEVIDGCLELIKNPAARLDELIKLIPGPDFPTSAIISGTTGIISAYKTGRGVITIKAVSEIVTKKDRDYIIISEIPYQVNKAKLIESIATLVKDKRVEGISDIRDESSREGMRIVITVKKNDNAQVILNRLYKFTQLQISFGIILLALDARTQPRIWNLKETLEAFIAHRRDVVTRRSIYELKKTEARAHILDGLKKALDHIDDVIQTIKASREAEVAKANLITKFAFSEIQAKAILEMRLQRITGLERDKILADLEEAQKYIAWLKTILGDVKEIYKIITAELIEIKKKYGNPRKTKIEGASADIEDEDLIASEEMIVCITNSGTIKRIPVDDYRVQKRGGKGVKGSNDQEEDYVRYFFAANTKTTILVISDKGRMHWLKVHRIPEGSRTAKGKSVANVLNLSAGENVRAFIPVDEFDPKKYVVMITEKGIIKKSSLELFAHVKATGLIALTTDLNDSVMEAKICDENSHIFISTSDGQSIRFEQKLVRAMGRTARGMKGIKLSSDKESVVGMDIIPAECKDTILVVTSLGYGKRTSVEEYKTQGRAGVGIITQKVSDRVGLVVSVRLVSEKDHVMITTNKGQSIRMKATDISIIGRNTQGVKLIDLNEGEIVTGMALIAEDESEDASNEPTNLQ